MSVDQFEMMEVIHSKTIEAMNKKNENSSNNESNTDNQSVLEDGQTAQNGNTKPLEEGNLSEEQPEPKVEDSAVAVPEDLKEYADLLKTRGWDAKVSNPIDLAKEVLKSYSEADKELGKKGHLTGVLTEKLDEYEGIFAGDPTRINEARKAAGLEPFQFADPEEKAVEFNNLFNLFREAYSALESGKPNPLVETKIFEAVQKINDDARIHQKLKANQSPSSVESLKANARKSIQAVAQDSNEKYDDVIARFDVVHKDIDISNLLTSIAGVNLLSLVSTPERAKAFNKLTSYVQKGMNFEAEVKKEVEKRVAEKQKQLRSSQNAGGSNGGGISPQGQRQINTHAKELLEMSRSGRSIIH